jgi:hypothetical protein
MTSIYAFCHILDYIKATFPLVSVFARAPPTAVLIHYSVLDIEFYLLGCS